MTPYRLKNEEVIELDAEIASALLGETWNVTQAGTVARSYWDKGERRPRRQTLTERVTGQKAPAGMVWVHSDDDWKNFRRENLVLRERGRHHDRAFGGMTHDQLVETGRKGGSRTRQTKTNAIGYRGVHASGQKFRAIAAVDGRQKYLGLFESRKEAACAYDAALLAQGLKAVNFPE